jgi:O-succinylbenzoic acid--CoA ligase
LRVGQKSRSSNPSQPLTKNTSLLGSIDDRDFLTITGRHDESIIRAGSTIMPLAVEAAVREHPLVGDAVAVGLPHPRDGECVGVQIVARSGRAPTEDELREHCARLLPAAAVPDRIDVVPALPLSGSGKIRRAAVRQRMLQMPRARP